MKWDEHDNDDMMMRNMRMDGKQRNTQPFKDCNPDGTWYRHPETNKSWSDYTPCTDTTSVRRAQDILNIYFGGYSLSVFTLLIALFIFCYYRQLNCTRVSIHKHMFLSYILAAVFWISYYASTTLQSDILIESPLWCRVLHVIAQYATCSNYAWMFCEGFYLHTILVYTFINEEYLLKSCYVIGWVFPLLQTVTYFVIRIASEETGKMCWHGQVKLQWILLGPIILELLVNTLFLINILRILGRKGVAVNRVNRPNSFPIRRTLRATLILIPLLGIQYLAIPYRPDGDKVIVHFYNILSAVLVSFQGFLVAFLFCFFNGEVIFLLKNQIRTTLSMRRRLSRSDTIRSTFYSQLPNGRGRARLSICKSSVPSQDKTPSDENNKTESQQVSDVGDIVAMSVV